MGLRRVLLFTEVLLVLIEVPGLWPGPVARSPRLGLAEFSRPSRDEPAPVMVWLAAVGRHAASWELVPSWAGPGLHLSARYCVMSNRPRPTILCGYHGGCLIFSWSWVVTRGVSCRPIVAEISNGLVPSLLNQGPFRKQSIGCPLLFFLPHSPHLGSSAPELRPQGIRVPCLLRRHSAHPDPHPDGSQSFPAKREGPGGG
jgi:hypothetical protein